jgi:uncharacterized protein
MNIPPCDPPFWAESGHRQTLLGYLLPSGKFTQAGKVHIIPLADGDRLHTTLHEGETQTLILLFHGLNGTTQSNYMARTAKIIRSQGHSAVLVNHRDCGQGFGLATHPYHSGRGEDVSAVVAYYRKAFPKKRIIAIGFSLGGNALLNLLCGLHGTELPDFAISVNAPVDLQACSDSLKLGWNRIYDLRFVWSCRNEIHAKAKSHRIEFDTKIPYFSHLEDIDELYTAPFSGFLNARDYYEKCSTFNHFDKIKTPTILLMAKDDPFITWQPYLNAQRNPHVHLHLEEHGGHIGYLAKAGSSTRKFRRWLDDALNIILKEHG